MPTGNGQTEEFDPRPVYYDLDAVHQIASERLAPELAKRKELANQEAAAKLRIAESEAIYQTGRG